MPEYRAPGVFAEEAGFRAKSIEGVGTSTTAFVGLTARGATTRADTDPAPPLLTSFAEFQRYYGGTDTLLVAAAQVPNYLAHAARVFFENGGKRLHVARVLGPGAIAASAELQAGAALADAGKVTLVARQPGGATITGTSANFRVAVSEQEVPTTRQDALSQPAGTLVKAGGDFHIVGLEASPSFAALDDDAAVSVLTYTVEVHDPVGPVFQAAGLGVHRHHPRFIGAVLGADPPDPLDRLANPVRIAIGADVDPFGLRQALSDVAAAPDPISLTGGTDGMTTPPPQAFQAALDRLLALEEVAIVAAPGSSSFADAEAITRALVAHAETPRAYRIALLDPPPGLDVAGISALKSGIDSRNAALYYPWIRMADPLAAGAIDLPPSGAVAGIYARTDLQRGVWKAPANEIVTGAVGLQRDVRFGEQEVLNPLGVNCISTLTNRGIRVWGARTASSDPEWKYVNFRRYFLYLERSIDRGTQWAVFEPNGEALWANLRTMVADFLHNEWTRGALLGTKPEEAFFVRCDRSTMTPADLDNGRVVCLIGVAPIGPAEFVIFRIGQKTADAPG